MIYGYMRVSTTGQTKGNSFEEQERLLRKNGATELYQDAFTGTRTDRPNFTILLNKLQEGDTLVITKLDRFARNTAEGLNVIQHLLERGVKVNILNMGTIDTTPTGKLILTVMLAFAEFERDMIVQRTTEGKAIARTKDNFIEGRPPKYDEATLQAAMSLLEKYNYREVAAITGISKSTLYRMRNKLVNSGQAKNMEENSDKP
ncbi:MAG: recombinase family protein [Peptococcaceae bacterium]|nr:recombinase family protein [Peptococcaceae bacterium]MBQ3204953.1 recombinase family protein [Peptococcaceae bacterium]MBQ6853191.1 recombinase family protein [Peptococcaceae bacterium]MBQ7025692.1 recombinase family protein [Peptococcaceae bacterium]